MEHFALGIDIGGTTTTFGTVSREWKISFEHVLATKDYPTAEDLLQAIYSVLNKNGLINNILGVGIGAPNGNSKTGQIEFAPNLIWKGIVPICAITEELFHRPALLSNDANAAALGEKMFGVAKDEADFVSITLGTGLGSGVFINDQLVEGAHGFAGEFGHIRVIPGGRMCGCGRQGCLETYASATGVKRTLQEFIEENPDKKDFYENLDPKTLFEKAKSNDPFCLRIVDYTADVLGSALADFACFSDPKMYVLFGGIAQSGDFFTDKVKLAMERNLLKVLEHKIEVKTSELNNRNAAVLGTAASIFWKIIKH